MRTGHFLLFTELLKEAINLFLCAHKLISLISIGFAVNSLHFFTSLYTALQMHIGQDKNGFNSLLTFYQVSVNM